MSSFIALLVSKWTVVLPSLIALVSLLFGGFQKRKAGNEKTRSDKSREEVQDEVIRNRTDRNHFSD